MLLLKRLDSSIFVLPALSLLATPHVDSGDIAVAPVALKGVGGYAQTSGRFSRTTRLPFDGIRRLSALA
jgi:hypothetical protein